MNEEKLSVRLEAFLAAREGMRGVDPEEVFRANGVELTMTDLREAAQLARRVEEAPATILATCHTDDSIELTAQVPADAPGTWCSGQRVLLVREE